MAKICIKDTEQLSYEANEAYRTLRTRITLYGSDVKAIAVTSSKPKEGKTSIAFNLAMSMAKIGKRVIFIDADLRKSNLIKRYSIKEKVNGFDLYLSEKEPITEVIYETNINNLDMILAVSSCSNATELLDSVPFKKLIPFLKQGYDYIFIDTPALGNIIDSAIVARECDGTIIVIEENLVSRKQARQVIGQVEETGCQILGVVINKTTSLRPDAKNDKYYNDNL